MSFASLITAPAGTARYTLDTLALGFDKPPVLIGQYAGASNAAYQTAVIKLANAQRGRSSTMTAARAREGRELDAKLFAATVITGWENVGEVPGVATPFSAEKAEELLLLLAAERPDVLAGITAYFRDADNFGGTVDASALGKG